MLQWIGDTRGGNSEYLVEAARDMTYSGGVNIYSNTLDLNTIPISILNTDLYGNLLGVPNMVILSLFHSPNYTN